MAKIVGGVPPFIGTRDNLTIYLMNGAYIIRTKSSLTGKRVKRDPTFAKTMKYAGWLKQASKIASLIYKQMPVDERIYKQYRQLTGKAMSLLKEGFGTDDVITMLEAVCQPVKNVGGRSTESYREYTGEYSSGDISERSSESDSEYARKYYSEYSNENSSERSSESDNEYACKYCRESTGVYSNDRVKYHRVQTRLYISKCGSGRPDKCNNKCSYIVIECNGNVQKRVNILISMYCLAIVLETGRSERCRWEPLALVI